MTATSEFVVPRSMPTINSAISAHPWCSSDRRPDRSRVCCGDSDDQGCQKGGQEKSGNLGNLGRNGATSLACSDERSIDQAIVIDTLSGDLDLGVAEHDI